ncbi:histidine phosphatase family protein [Arenibacter sp. GZD96]|uniref:SixA phosphatase family protein n=1 Tax=Aurantibrevibacter litoralis TaxID=3106030 RepID=UPI002AFE5151|nr:histidine phosphatase family protein [Arenibacter sp. GZD-96]MEA1784927.1 histidine phosphatase family protein [Arenibacter sp. GZD-96]
MKTIILVRHAKSTWDYLVDDVDRPLAESGIKDAYLVAQRFHLQSTKTDAVYSSPAARALMTSMIFMRVLNFSYTSFSVAEALYDFSGERVRHFVKNLDNTKNTVMLFGHNHAFTELANLWGNTPIENVSTAGLVQINFEVDHWKSIGQGSTTTTLFPKQLR